MFCGCGGLSAGFGLANEGNSFRVLGGVDVDNHAVATYKDQIKAPALIADVRTLLSDEALLDAQKVWRPRGKGPLVVIGGPPCQGFSAHRKKDERSDSRNDLVDVFFQVALKLCPEFIVMENVPEVFDDKHWPAIARSIAKVEEAGYRVRARVHNLADFGVPQARFRAVIVARRAGRLFNFPIGLQQVHQTVRDAIGGLPPIKAGERHSGDAMHVAPAHTNRILELIASVPHDGGSRREANQSLLPNCHEEVDGFRDVYGRLAWDRPSISITAKSSTPSCGRFLHPQQDRNISVREAALLQGFPGDFMFSGPLVQLYRQIGNAVSPIFARHLAEKIDLELRSPSIVCDELEHDVSTAQGRSFTSSIASRKKERSNRRTLSYRPTAIDLFSGAGGLSLGLLQAGFDLRFALDNDSDAVRTYRYNLGPHIVERSATEMSFEEILSRSNLRSGECDFLVGGPPCQGFSQHRRGDDDDDRNELVHWFGSAISFIRPKAFMLENVPYIAAKRGRRILANFVQQVQDAGYRVQTAIVDASNYGIAQRRQRFIAIGFSNEVSGGYSLPLHADVAPQTIRDAIGHLPSPDLKLEHPDFANHVGTAISELNRERISYVPQGGGWTDIPEHLRLNCHTNHRGHGHLDVYGRLNWTGLATTITAHSDSFTRGRYAHPEENRPLTGRELAALQSFPAWFRFVADKKSVARLIGNAVPPALARVLAVSVMEELSRPENLRLKIRRVA
nr:DNA cytosine methyltransferase [Agrobacterium tumefaciens]